MTARARSASDNKADDDTDTKSDAKAETSDKADDKSSDKPKSSGTAYLNTSGGPLVYDKEGHQVADGEWTPEINLDAIGKGARQNGYLRPQSEV